MAVNCTSWAIIIGWAYTALDASSKGRKSIRQIDEFIYILQVLTSIDGSSKTAPLIELSFRRAHQPLRVRPLAVPHCHCQKVSELSCGSAHGRLGRAASVDGLWSMINLTAQIVTCGTWTLQLETPSRDCTGSLEQCSTKGAHSNRRTRSVRCRS